MIVLFPLANDYLSSSDFYRFTYSVVKILFPDISYKSFGTVYLVIRKLIHFISYALLSLLLFRAFYGFSNQKWDPKWILYSAAISLAYGIADESIQKFLPNRHGNVVDVLIDMSGICVALGIVWSRKNKLISKA